MNTPLVTQLVSHVAPRAAEVSTDDLVRIALYANTLAEFVSLKSRVGIVLQSRIAEVLEMDLKEHVRALHAMTAGDDPSAMFAQHAASLEKKMQAATMAIIVRILDDVMAAPCARDLLAMLVQRLSGPVQWRASLPPAKIVALLSSLAKHKLPCLSFCEDVASWMKQSCITLSLTQVTTVMLSFVQLGIPRSRIFRSTQPAAYVRSASIPNSLADGAVRVCPTGLEKRQNCSAVPATAAHVGIGSWGEGHHFHAVVSRADGACQRRQGPLRCPDGTHQ